MKMRNGKWEGTSVTVLSMWMKVVQHFVHVRIAIIRLGGRYSTV